MGFCPDCQYDLRDLPAGVCPECGAAFHPRDLVAVVGAPRPVHVLLWWLHWIMAGWALIVFGVFQSTRAVGGLIIGHWPQYMVDDPGTIPGLEPFLFASLAGCMALPLAWSGCMVLPVVLAVRHREVMGALMLVAAIVLQLAGVLLLWNDPFGTIEWWLD